MANDWPDQSDAGGMTRRRFIHATSAVAAGVVLSQGGASAAPGNPSLGVSCLLTINGREHFLTLDPRVTLLDLLREQLGLTGTKKGCDHGQCGACTVLVNGRRINSCLSLAVTHDDDDIVTVEGLAQGEHLHPVQAAFIEHDGFQCGYCTPGQICSAVALMAEIQNQEASQVTPNLREIGPVELTDDEIRERMSGNLCRCGAYPGIVAAVRRASQRSLSPALPKAARS